MDFLSAKQKALFFFVARLTHHFDLLYPCGYDIFKKRFPKKQVTLTPGSFTDLALFRPAEKKKKIVFLSRLMWAKYPDLFVRAALLIREQLTEKGYRLYMCGSGPMFEEMQDMLRENGAAEYIEMPGNVKPEEMFPDTEIFLSLQAFNNYPSQALIEALACGSMVVATDIGDTDRIVKPPFGVLCEPEPQSVADAILACADRTPEEKTTAAQSARAFAEAEFTVEKSRDHYRSLFLNGFENSL
jgi:glycosyltransferase involved in cell wall biosynthesis